MWTGIWRRCACCAASCGASRRCASSKRKCCRSSTSRAIRSRTAAAPRRRRNRRRRARPDAGGARRRRQPQPPAPPPVAQPPPASRRRRRRRRPAAGAAGCRPGSTDGKIRNEKDLERYQAIFENAAFWKKLGEEHQNPLIVTGTVLFTNTQSSGFVNHEPRDHRPARPPRRPALPRLHGAQGLHHRAAVRLHRRPHRRGALFRPLPRRGPLSGLSSRRPALSSYFELMDRLIPSFLGSLSTQRIRGTRVLLK